MLLLLATSVQAADLVQIPEDYKMEEVPVGSVMQPKADVVIPGSSTEIEALSVKGGTNIDNSEIKCDLTYAKDPVRRVIPKGASIKVESATANNLGTITPAICFQNGQAREWQEMVYIVSTKSGFKGSLRCYVHASFTASDDTACEAYITPRLRDLSSKFLFWGDKDKIVKIEGDQL